MKICDLHTHSVYSDGTWTPQQLVDEAERIGLGAIALCDHNTVDGLPEFLAHAQGREVQAVPGVELSTDYEGTELHIVGLFLQPEHYSIITEKLQDYQRRKDESNRLLIRALQQAGFDISYEQIVSATPNGQFNRAHVAAELTRKGYTESIQDAFCRLLKPEQGYYVPAMRMTAYEGIRFIKSLGAVAVLAHPLLSMKEQQLRAFLPEAVACGLDAMETHYVSYDEDTTALAERIAAQFGLQHSGGSDFHGDRKPGIALGTGRGTLLVPMYFCDALRKRVTRSQR